MPMSCLVGPRADHVLGCLDPKPDRTLAHQSASQDKAIEDALFLLDKALGNEAIDCKRYLILVRKYAKQQFFIKELANKLIAKRRQLGVY